MKGQDKNTYIEKLSIQSEPSEFFNRIASSICSTNEIRSNHEDTLLTNTKICLMDLINNPISLQVMQIKNEEKSKVESIQDGEKLRKDKIMEEYSSRIQKNIKLKREKEKDRLTNEMNITLCKTGYLVKPELFNDSKAKIRRISIHRRHFNKEFSSVKQYRENKKFMPKQKEELEYYSSDKSRCISITTKKIKSADLELYDSNPKKSLFFKVFIDEAIGITSSVQYELIERIADEDVESDEELILSSTLKVKRDLIEVISMVNLFGVEGNLVNKCRKFSIKPIFE
jgi:hypothetical protein